MAFSSYALQYSSLDVTAIINANPDLLITEGGPQTAFAASAVTQAELANLQASGTKVVAYINVAVTDDARPYWDPAWTDDGTDTGIPTAAAPAWLTGQPTNPFGYVVDFSNQDWQDIVIAQAVDLVTSGFDGVFLDDFAQYFVSGATGLSISEQATVMMQFALAIDAAIKAVNPNAYLITNGNPYVVTDGVGGATSTTSVDFLAALDAMLLESYYGINGCQDAAIAHTQTYIQSHADILALEYGGTPYQNYLFQQSAAANGFLSFAANDASYSGFGIIAGETSGNDKLLGTSCNDLVTGSLGADTIDGGDGIDTLDLSGATNTQKVNLVTNVNIGGFAHNDTFLNIENVIGSATRGDDITGTAGSNTLQGLGTDDILRGFNGDDILEGGENNDYLYGGRGADVLDGGNGLDWAMYNDSSHGVIVDLGGVGSGGIYSDGDTYISIERVRGSDFADSITMDGASNKVLAGDGDDTIFGMGGKDSLRGGNDNDRINGGTGNDTMFGDAGADIFEFDLGNDADWVADFENDIDTIELDGNLAGGAIAGMTIADIVTTYGNQINANRIDLNFGNGDVLKILATGILPADLYDDISVV